VQVLIDAGSSLNNNGKKGSLDILLDECDFWFPNLVSYMEMLADIVQLMVINGGKLQLYRNEGPWTIVGMSSRIGRLPDCLVSPDTFNELMIILSRMFRWILLSNPAAVRITDVIPEFPFVSAKFVDAFIDLARYSSSSDQPNRLVHCILNAMTASDLNELIRVLSAKFSSTEVGFSPSRTVCTKNALEWVRGVAVPFSLQHIARTRIIRVMSDRSLSDTSTLGLPNKLMQYVLFNTH